MSQMVTKNSKTQFVIAIDDEEDCDHIEHIHQTIDDRNSDQNIARNVSQTLESVLDTIESNVDLNHNINTESEIEITEINTKENSFINGSQDVVNQRINDINVLPFDEIENVNDIDINIYNDESNDSLIIETDMASDKLDVEAEEAEDCMILDNYNFHSNDQNDEQLFNDDIVFIEESNIKTNTNTNQLEEKEVIEISDDEEDCLIINDSSQSTVFEPKEYKRTNATHKRSLSPIYTSESFIPLSQPSTSWAHRTSFETNNRSNAQLNKEWFRKSVIHNDSLDSDNRNNSQNTSRTYDSSQNKLDSIPFLYEDSFPSSSTDVSTADSSNAQEIDLIADCVKLERPIVQNVINLIEDQCTVPFIVRYRQSFIRGIDADKVRKITTVYNELKRSRERAKEVEMCLLKQNRLNPSLKEALRKCKNVFEVEHLYRLTRNESEDSEKAKNLGLSDTAIQVLEGKRLDPKHFVNRFSLGIDSVEAVTNGWSAIIADIISKDCDVLEYLISSYRQHIPTLEVVVCEEKLEELLRDKDSRNADIIQKYLRFSCFKKPIDKISAHTLMAIERGESIGLLRVYVEFPTAILNKLIDFCLLKFNRAVPHFLVNCVRKAYNNQIKPSIADYIRYELRHSAHLTALDVFRNNVKHLLLEPPLRGETVIGVDPGFDSGCKIAVVSPWGVPLQYKTVKLDSIHSCDSAALTLKDLLSSSDCSIIALGNGSGCRKFEDLLLRKMRNGFFKPINVRYKIISESGVSWYSVTPEAKLEFPDIPPHIIGAISIARRLQDPLSELVKVDPKRLQVGMYMRDIDEEQVKNAFHEVAVECVSFCGVDVNVASFDVLSKVAGLGPNIARMIIDKRSRDGLFTSRSQLKNIDGIGWKQFEQCAGFVKIMPSTSKFTIYKRKNLSSNCANKKLATSTEDYDSLDSTIIHPESYSCANTYLELIGSNKDEIGKHSIRNKIENCYSRYSLPEIAELCNTHSSNMKLIIESLSNSIDYDHRINFKQIYLPDIQYFYELNEGSNLTGRVLNVTPMGAFIDCGIAGGINAYLSAKECEKHNISVNNNVLVRIVSINREMQRFRVSLLKVFNTNVKFT